MMSSTGVLCQEVLVLAAHGKYSWWILTQYRPWTGPHHSLTLRVNSDVVSLTTTETVSLNMMRTSFKYVRRKHNPSDPRYQFDKWRGFVIQSDLLQSVKSTCTLMQVRRHCSKPLEPRWVLCSYPGEAGRDERARERNILRELAINK